MFLSFLLVATAPAAENFQGFDYYLGDIHAHSGASVDGCSSDFGPAPNRDPACGAFADFLANAQAEGLDFLALVDHVNGPRAASESDWNQVLATALAGNDPAGGFVTLVAAELELVDPATLDPLGHKTLLLFGSDADLAGLTMADVQPNGTDNLVACSDVWTFMDGLTAAFGPAILVPHHPAAVMPMATDWSCHDPGYEPIVEVYSRHGQSLLSTLRYDPIWSAIDIPGTVHAAMAPTGFNWILGFAAGTDEHDSWPGRTCLPTPPTSAYAGGLTVAMVPESTPFGRAALQAAFEMRQVYATTGPLVPVYVDYVAGGTRLGGMGQVFRLGAGEDLEVDLQVEPSWDTFVTRVDLKFPDGTELRMTDVGVGEWTATVPAADIPTYLYPILTVDGRGWYGGPLACPDGGPTTDEKVWLTPSWFIVP